MNWVYTEDEWEEYAKSSKIIFSSCKECIFFTSPDKCSCGRLEKFEETGAKIVDVGEGDSLHKVINGRICNMYRINDWLKAMKISQKPDSFIESVARKETRIQTSLIIICEDNKETRKILDKKELRSKSKEKISQIVKTMKSATSSEISPKEIVLLNKSWIKPYDFINYLRIQCEDNNIKCKWRLENFNDQEDEDESVENVFKTIESGYCCLFFNGETVPENYFRNINKLLNYDLEAFLYLKPKEGMSGMFINSILFKQFFGNKSSYSLEEFFEQIEKVTKEQKCPQLIRSLDEVLQLPE